MSSNCEESEPTSDMGENGDHWQQAGAPPSGTVSTIVYDSTMSTLFAVSDGLLFRSQDEGATWYILERDNEINSIHIGPNGNLFAVVSDIDLIKSSDGGASWIELPSIGSGGAKPEGYTSWLDEVTITPAGFILIILVESNFDDERTESLRILTEGEAAWQAVTPNITGFTGDPYVFTVTAFADGSVLVSHIECHYMEPGCSDNVIFRAMEGIWEWEVVSVRSREDPYEPSFSGFMISANGDIFANTYFELFRSTDNGATWVDLEFGYQTLTMSYSPLGDIFVATRESQILRSGNNGNTWIEISPEMEGGEFFDFAFKGGELTFVGTSQGILHSNDRGATWLAINEQLPADQGSID